MLTVQISVSYLYVGLVVLFWGRCRYGVLFGKKTYRLQILLDFGVQGTSLESDNWGSSLGVVSNGRTALRAEDAVDGLAGGAVLCVALGWAIDGQGLLGDDSDKRCKKLESTLQRLDDCRRNCIQ